MVHVATGSIMRNRHRFLGWCLAVAVMILMSVSIHPAMAYEAINEEINCPTCSGGMNDISSIPGFENTTIPTISVREVNSVAGQTAIKAATAEGVQMRHFSSSITLAIQDPRSGQQNAGVNAAGLANPGAALTGFITNMSSAGYDFTGESSHRYESTLQSDDFLSLNSSQKQALVDGGFALTASDTAVSHQDVTYYTFTNRTTGDQVYVQDLQQIDARGNSVGERKYAVSPEFTPDGSAVKGSAVQGGYGAASTSGKSCFWLWVAMVTTAAIVVTLFIVLSIAFDGYALVAFAAAMADVLAADMLAADVAVVGPTTADEIFEKFVEMGVVDSWMFSSAMINMLTVSLLIFVVLFLYALYKLGVCKGWWPADIWMNHDWDHNGGDFGLSDNGKTKEIWQHSRFMLALFADTKADKDAKWTIVSQGNLVVRQSASAKVANDTTELGTFQVWIFEAAELGSHNLALKYQKTKSVPPTMEITDYTLPVTVVKIPFEITGVDATTSDYQTLAFDKSGIPHISYYDSKKHRIMYASYVNNAWTTEKVADTHGTYSLSLSFDPAGDPAISYGDGTKYGNLMYAHRDGSTSTWSVEKVDNGGTFGDVGQVSSLVFDPAGTPHIAYRDGSLAVDLKYATKNGNDWVISEIDGNNAGYEVSLALDSGGLPHVAYRTGDHYPNLKYSELDAAGIWTTATKIDDGGGIFSSTGYSPSLALDSVGNPHISYYDKTHKALMYASWDGIGWKTEPVVHGVGDAGEHSSLAIGTNNQPFISYNHKFFAKYEGTYSELHLANKDPDTQQWLIYVIDHESDCEQSSIALDPSDHPNIAYYDAKDKTLKYAGWKR